MNARHTVHVHVYYIQYMYTLYSVFMYIVGAVAISQPEEIDPYDLMDPVNMLEKMPKDFYERIVNT